MRPEARTSVDAIEYDKPIATQRGSKWNPRNWSLWTWLIAILVVVCALVAIIVGAVVGSRDSGSSYPDYSRLTYAIKDTCTYT